MSNYPYHFLVGFVVAFLLSLIFFENTYIKTVEPVLTSEVLSQTSQSDLDEEKREVRIEEEVEEQVASAEETSTPSPSPKPTNTFMPTPTPVPTLPPAPTPTPDVWSPPDMEPWFSQYAGQYGVDKNILERLANCESHFNPNAVSGIYAGMFQFSAQTWSNYRTEMGFDPSPDLRTNTEESIRTAAYAVLHKGVTPWPRCLN